MSEKRLLTIQEIKSCVHREKKSKRRIRCSKT